MRFLPLGVRSAVFSAFLALGATGCGGSGGGTNSIAPVTSTQASLTFTTLAGPPTSLSSGSAQSVALPAIPGLSAVGGTNSDHLMLTASGAVTAVITVTSTTTTGTAGGPPVALMSASRRSAQDSSGGTSTPLYYVGVTNTTNTPTQVNFSSLSLGTPNIPAGSSVALAHYDPAQPQEGWNQHCAFGPSKVTQNGNDTTFTPNANLTIYPGATLWFAPYTYPTSIGAPTPAPQGTGITPTPAPAPASLTGTYVGSTEQTSPSSQASQYLEFSLTQSGSNLSGTYAVVSNDTQKGNFGTFSGTVTNGTLALTTTPQDGSSCPVTISGTARGLLITGTWANISGSQCSNNSGTFSVVQQTASLPSISGNYSGTINDSYGGSGTISLSFTQPGTVFRGTVTVGWPSSSPESGGSNQFVGFAVNSTTVEFATISTGQGCNPNGTITISGNTLNGTYTGAGTSSIGCSAHGTFTVSQ